MLIMMVATAANSIVYAIKLAVFYTYQTAKNSFLKEFFEKSALKQSTILIPNS